MGLLKLCPSAGCLFLAPFHSSGLINGPCFGISTFSTRLSYPASQDVEGTHSILVTARVYGSMLREWTSNFNYTEFDRSEVGHENMHTWQCICLTSDTLDLGAGVWVVHLGSNGRESPDNPRVKADSSEKGLREVLKGSVREKEAARLDLRSGNYRDNDKCGVRGWRGRSERFRVAVAAALDAVPRAPVRRT